MNCSWWSRVRRSLFFVLPPIAVLSLTTVAATRPVAGNSAEAITAARAWVEAHKAVLPTTLEGIAAMPYSYRRVILYALPIEQQGALWREHWTAFITPAAERTPLQHRIVAGLSGPLTTEQVEFIRSEIANIPSVYTSALTAEERSRKGEALCTRAQAIFSPADVAVIMLALGGPDDSYIWPSPAGEPLIRLSTSSFTWSMIANVRDAARQLGIVPPPRMNPCFCPQGTSCECYGNLCVQSWPACENGPWLCSCGGLRPCDGGKCAPWENQT